MTLEVVVTVTYGMTASTIILNKINFLKAKISSDKDAADDTEHLYLPKKELPSDAVSENSNAKRGSN